MPARFLSFYGKVSRLDKKLVLPPQTALLIRECVASINGCLFCMDIARWFAMKASVDNRALRRARRLPDQSAVHRRRARALDYATELTSEKKVAPATFDRLARYYSDREICDIVWLVATEHLYNVSNIGLNIGSDGLCEVRQHAQPRSRLISKLGSDPRRQERP